MASIRDLLQDKKKRIVSRGNSCIPSLNSPEPFLYAANFFKEYTRSIPDVDKITIIDPYIIPLDLDNLSSLFGGCRNINLDIISKFDSSNSEECDDEKKEGEDKKTDGKIERKNMILERRKFLLDNGVFSDIGLTHSIEPMHDRYYIFWFEDRLISAFSIGGSIAQRFGSYISIIEINDSYLLWSINKLYLKLKSKTKGYL